MFFSSELIFYKLLQIRKPVSFWSHFL